MESGGVQLTVNDEVLAFDYSQYNDLVVVASKKCTELFNPHQCGSPSFILFHEQPHPVKQIKFQKGKGSILSLVFNNSLTIYDPNKSVCPLIDTIKPSSFIIDHDWSRFCIQSLASITNSDELFLWDTRHTTRPTHQITIRKPCGKVEWCPWNSNLIGVSSDDRYLLLWDTRMMRSSGISSSMHIIEPPGGIVHYTWSQKSNYLFVATGRSQVEQWSVGCGSGGNFDCNDVVTSQCDRPTNNTTRLTAGLDRVFLSTNPTFGQQLSSVVKCPASNGESVLSIERGSHIRYNCGFKKHTPSDELSVVNNVTCFENDNSQMWRDLAISERVGVVGMSWAPHTEWASSSSDDALLVLTTSGMLQVLSPTDTKRSQEAEKPTAYVLRNARHLQTTPSSELRISGETSLNNRRASSAPRFSFTSTKNGLNGAHPGRSVVTPVHQVVGPLSFLSLLEDELTVLDSAIRSSNGLLEGLRIERLDQFARRIVLEVLIPSIDSYAMRNKIGSIASLGSAGHDGALAHYYRSEDLHQFLKKGAGFTSSAAVQVHSSCTVRSVSLIISFPIKYSGFWMPSFVVDNKANIELGGETAMSAIVSELAGICRAFVASTSPPASRRVSVQSAAVSTSSVRNVSASVAPSTSVEDSIADSLLLQLARTFRRRILRCWEKKMDVDRLSVSFGSARQGGSADNVCSSSGGLSGGLLAERAAAVVEQSISLGSSSGEHKFVDASSSYFNSIEPLAFRVPYPTSSAGFFNGFGELVCFGGARLQCKDKDSPHSVASRPELHIVDGVGKGDCHRSYATYLITTILSRSESDMTFNTITSPSSSEPRLSEDEGEVDCDERQLGASATGNRKAAVSADDEDDDYQFSFDKDTTRTSVAHSADRSSDQTDLPVIEEQFWAAPSKVVELQMSDKSSHDPHNTYPVPSISFGGVDTRSNASLQSYFVADLDGKSDVPLLSTSSPFTTLSVAKPLRRTSSVYEVNVQSVLMGLERRLCALYSTGPLEEASTGSTAPSSSSVRLFDVASVRQRSEACRFNATMVDATSPDSSALVQFWNLLAVCLDVSTLPDTGGLISWNDSALGSSLFFRLLQYLRELNDLQTFAVTVCVVGGAARVVELLKAHHSGPSESGEGTLDPVQLEKDIDAVLYSYAQLLQQWGEKLLATEVVKYMSFVPEGAEGMCAVVVQAKLSVSINCFNCNKVVAQSMESCSEDEACRFMWCRDCRDWAQYCSVCQSCVRGVFSVCALCGHGGHADHMTSWFTRYDECATGCGCRCTYTKTGPSSRNSSSNWLNEEDSREGSGSDDDDEDEDEDDIYERAHHMQALDSNNSIDSLDKIKASVYDTYDFNSSRPHYIESVLSESNYREYNYNNFYETMQDYLLPTDSILEEEEDDDDDDDEE